MLDTPTNPKLTPPSVNGRRTEQISKQGDDSEFSNMLEAAEIAISPDHRVEIIDDLDSEPTLQSQMGAPSNENTAAQDDVFDTTFGREYELTAFTVSEREMSLAGRFQKRNDPILPNTRPDRIAVTNTAQSPAVALHSADMLTDTELQQAGTKDVFSTQRDERAGSRLEAISAMPKDGVELAPRMQVDRPAIAPATSETGPVLLNPPAQTLLQAVRENSDWSTFISSPTVRATQTESPDGSVLKVLKVQLQPLELGKIELSLRMKNGQLQIEVRTASERAQLALSLDQTELIRTMHSMGYKVDNLVIVGPSGFAEDAQQTGPRLMSDQESNGQSFGRDDGDANQVTPDRQEVLDSSADLPENPQAAVGII